MDVAKLKKAGQPTVLLAAGAIAGAVIAGTMAADAASSPSAAPTAPYGNPYAGPMEAPGAAGGHVDESPLTGTTKDKVEAAVLAKYPDATIERTETDSDGVYESHITTKSGRRLTVQVDKSFDITGTEDFGPH